ncbi:MAG: amidohydrolase family protein [Bacillota bacterium]|nr:amidohydrolase family protein [Bacillota bacterium]
MITSDNYILTNITIIDGMGNEPAEGQFMHVKGRHIARVGSMADLDNTADTEVIDYSGKYIMPGMIDAHIHMVGGRGCGDWGDTEILCEPDQVRSMRSVYEAQKMLKYGFTTVRDISWNSLYLKRIFDDDVMPGPKVVACGPGLARTGGHCDSPQFDLDYVRKHHFWAIISDGVDECRRNVRKVLREGADQIKFWGTGGGNWGTDRISDTHYSFEEMKAICDEAHMIKGTLVCAHCETEESIRMAIEAGVDTIEHGEELTEELVDMMVEKGIILVPTLYLIANWYDIIDLPGNDAPKLIRPDAFLQRDLGIGAMITDEDKAAYKERTLSSYRMALEKGVRIAVGSDTVYEPACEYGQQTLDEYKELIDRGMTVLQGIQAATENAAYACAMQHRVGAIREGLEADFLVLDENPASSAEVLHNHDSIKQVFLNGKTVVENGLLMW